MCPFVVKMQEKKNPKFSHLFELWAESISVYSVAWRLVALLLVPVKSVAAVATGNAACIMNIFAC